MLYQLINVQLGPYSFRLVDITFNKAKRVCLKIMPNDSVGEIETRIYKSPVLEIGGYHGQPTLELEDGTTIWFDPKTPDVSDVFVWGLQAKLRMAEL